MLASTQARAGAKPSGTQLSQTVFMAAKSCISFIKIVADRICFLSLPLLQKHIHHGQHTRGLLFDSLLRVSADLAAEADGTVGLYDPAHALFGFKTLNQG